MHKGKKMYIKKIDFFDSLCVHLEQKNIQNNSDLLYFNNKIKNLSLKTRIRLGKNIKNRFCRQCFRNFQVNDQKSTKQYTFFECLVCGKTRKQFFTAKKKELEKIVESKK